MSMVPQYARRGPALGGPPTYRFLRTRVTGPCMRPYNVPNDCMLAPSASCVQNKLQLAGSHRHWPLSSLQSAQSAAGAPYTVRGGEHLRPSALPQRCSRCISWTGYHMFRFDVEHRLTLCRHLRSTDPCLFAIIRRLPTRLGSTREKVHGACMVGRV